MKHFKSPVSLSKFHLDYQDYYNDYTDPTTEKLYRITEHLRNPPVRKPKKPELYVHQGLFEKSYQPVNKNWYEEGVTSVNKENHHLMQKRSESNEGFSEVVNFYPLPDEEEVLERPIRGDKHWETLKNQIDRLLKSKLIDKVNEPMEPTRTCRPIFKEFQFSTGTVPNDLLPGHQGNLNTIS